MTVAPAAPRTGQASSLQLGEHAAIDLVLDHGRFLGLGSVRVGDLALRCPRRPVSFEIRTPDAVELCDYRLDDCQGDPQRGYDLTLAAHARDAGLMEWMVHEVRPRYRTDDWSRAPQPARDTTLTLELRPVTRRFEEWTFTGLSYRYRYRSASLPIYRILDRATWEPAGRAVGNQFWMRSCFSPPIARFTDIAQAFSTEWVMPSIAQPYIVQFLPLQTELQGFTFTAGAHGVLVTWPTQVAHVRSLFEKPAGEDLIVHWHEHCGDLAHEFVTSPVEVLHLPVAGDDTHLANVYHAVREQVYDDLHAQAGIRREYASTHGMIETWTDADLDNYRRRGLPKLLAAGMKKVYLANHFQNNMNTYGVSNMCCTVDYRVADSVGEDKLKAFCDDAKSGGAKVEMWTNTALSTLSVILDKQNGQAKRVDFLPREGSIMAALDAAAQPFVRNPSGAIEADHYTPVFAVLNLRDPVVREYWRQRWQHAHDHIGLESIFLDSSFNLSSDKFHWQANALPKTNGSVTPDQVQHLGHARPARGMPALIHSQYHAHLELVAQMQKMGFDYGNEDLGVFGIHRHGPSLLRRLDNLWLWCECIACFDVRALRDAGAQPDDVFFQGLAHRMMWAVYWDPQTDALTYHHEGLRHEDDRPTADQLAMLGAFNAVSHAMRRPRELPGRAGVVHRHGDTRVLWCFTDTTLDLPGECAITEVLSGERSRGSRIVGQRHRVYLAQPIA
jgi:hypothetical protein